MSGLFLTLFASLALGQVRPPIADPAENYLIEGQVLSTDGAPAKGVRIRGHRHDNPSLIMFDTLTDKNGRFQFEQHSLGWPDHQWLILVTRPACKDQVVVADLDFDGHVTLKITLEKCPKP